MTKKINLAILSYIILAVIIYMPIFGHLDTIPIQIWDESRLAINAYEMHKNGNFIVTHYEGNPDMWNTKPPMMIWMQVFWMQVVGVNELAVRLPSAIAALFTIILILIFFQGYLKSSRLGFISALVLVSSSGYIGFHATRTGDYDSLLTFFTTAGSLAIFKYIQSKKPLFLYLFFLATSFAVLTKSVSGLFFIPGIVLYVLIDKKALLFLKNKHFYFGLSSFLILVLGYYFMRESANPGYLEAVYNNELGGRFNEAIEEHKGDFWFYFNNLLEFQLPYWSFLIVPGLLLGLLVKDEKINQFAKFSSILSVSFFIVISSAQTKLDWYDVPLFPFFAMLIAVGLNIVFDFLKQNQWFSSTLRFNIIPYFFIISIVLSPYFEVIDKTYKPEVPPQEKSFYGISLFLKDVIDGKHEVNKKFLIYENWNSHILFYMNVLSDKNINFIIKKKELVVQGDEIYVQQDNLKEYIENNYSYTIIGNIYNVTNYKINGRKKN